MSILSQLNDCRVRYRSGSYVEAARISSSVLARLEDSACHSSGSRFIDYIDASTLHGLARLGIPGATTRELGRRQLEELHMLGFPDHASPATVVELLDDPEVRNTFAFGQLLLAELAASALDPPRRIEAFLGSLEPMIQACRLPLIECFWRFLGARSNRLLGRWRIAVEEWMLVAREIECASECPNATQAGYPPGRALAEVATTLEAVDVPSSDLESVVQLAWKCRSLDIWDRTVIEGVCARRGWSTPASGSGNLICTAIDEELGRTRADRDFCICKQPTDADALNLLQVLQEAPLAAKLIYPWRAIRALWARGAHVPTVLMAWLDEVFASLNDEIRTDFALPSTIDDLRSGTSIALVRCLQI